MASLPSPPRDATSYLVATVTPRLQRLNYRLSSQGNDAIVFDKTYRPVWLAIPCVFFFPLGLLSLLYKKRIDLTFTIQPGAEGSEVQFSGYGPPGVAEQLRADLESRKSALAEKSERLASGFGAKGDADPS